MKGHTSIQMSAIGAWLQKTSLGLEAEITLIRPTQLLTHTTTAALGFTEHFLSSSQRQQLTTLRKTH